jgi:UDP-glucose 4-epimerase
MRDGHADARQPQRSSPYAIRSFKRALVTGCAGFLGSTLSEALLERGSSVVGVDCFTDYYPRELKEANLRRLRDHSGFMLLELDLSRDPLAGVLDGCDCVFHLAAQAGVRGSFGATFETYVQNNVLATQRLLEQATGSSLASFVYASSSSVYGNAETYPTDESSPRRPVSPYGMTKVATEELAGVYHRSFGTPVVGLRYFTAYGPRQRPDMAFTRMIRNTVSGEPITIYGDGRQVRDFTFVEDVVAGTILAAERGRPGAVYNIGGGKPVELRDAVALIEELVGQPVLIDRRPAQVGDARRTGCDPTLASRELGYRANTELADGLAAQLEWVLETTIPRPRRLAAANW